MSLAEARSRREKYHNSMRSMPGEETMTDKRVVVPEGMLKAVEIVALSRTMPRGGSILPNILEAALLWQKDNAPVPNDEQLKILSSDAEKSDIEIGFKRRKWYIREWIVRMYDDPDPKVREVPQYILDLRQIHFDLTERPEKTSIPLVVERIEEVLCALGDKTPEQEVPEEIKDMMWGEVTRPRNYDEAILEAYRRGKKSGTK